MEVEDDVCPVRDEEPVAHVHALLGESVQLLEQRRNVHHHAVADDALRLPVQDAGRNEVELVLDVVHHNGVS